MSDILLATLPTLAGALLGGRDGAIAGANASHEGFKTKIAYDKEDRKLELEKALKDREFDIKKEEQKRKDEKELKDDDHWHKKYEQDERMLTAKQQENAINRANKYNQQQIGLMNDLRKERNGLPVTKATQEVAAAYNKMQLAAQKPKDPTAHMSLIFGFMKMQDPNSTVREGEYASAEQARGIPAGIVNLYNKAVDGTPLTETQIKQFLGQAQNIYKSQQALQAKADVTFTQLADKHKIDRSDVLTNFTSEVYPTRDEILRELNRRQEAKK